MQISWKSILQLAGPTMLEQFMHTAVQYIDTAMVGSLGTQATAAVGSTSTVNWLVGSTISAIGVGFLSLTAKARGAGDEETAHRVAGQAALGVLISGILFTIITLSLSGLIPKWMQVDPNVQALASRYFFILYTPMLFRAASMIFGTVLRASGDTKTPMKIGILVNLTNVVLNFLMIYPARTITVFSQTLPLPGFGLGVTGAAIASAIAFTVGGVLMTIAVCRHPAVSPKGTSLRPDPAILRPALRVAFPNMLQRLATSLGYVTFASMINSLGEASTAAHTIANTVESAFYIPAFGMQTAAATLTGNALGAGDFDRMKPLGKSLLTLELALMAVSGSLLFLFAPNMISIFTKDTVVTAMGTTVLRMVAVSEPFYGVSVIVEGMMLGIGEAKKPFWFNLAGMWGVRILGTMLALTVFGGGLTAAWGCMITHNMLLFSVNLWQYLSGRWKKKVKF